MGRGINTQDFFSKVDNHKKKARLSRTSVNVSPSSKTAATRTSGISKETTKKRRLYKVSGSKINEIEENLRQTASLLEDDAHLEDNSASGASVPPSQEDVEKKNKLIIEKGLEKGYLKHLNEAEIVDWVKRNGADFCRDIILQEGTFHFKTMAEEYARNVPRVSSLRIARSPLRSLCGYYGPQGRLIVASTLQNICNNDFFTDIYKRKSVPKWLFKYSNPSLVDSLFTTEALLEMMRQDKELDSYQAALDLLQESDEYGQLVFPLDMNVRADDSEDEY